MGKEVKIYYIPLENSQSRTHIFMCNLIRQSSVGGFCAGSESKRINSGALNRIKSIHSGLNRRSPAATC